jgi:pimeloyl-ACP methyl ester carboxylesterase
MTPRVRDSPRRLFLALAGALGLLCLPAASAAASRSVVKHVRVNGISIGYRTVGSGRPLVLIPGFAFTMAEWDPKLVAALAKRHRVVLFDNRGVATSTDTQGNVLSIDEMAGDTARLIGALHLGRSDVLGWSMGGYIAQKLALGHPGSVRRLVLASTDFGGSRAIQPSAKVIRELQHAHSFSQLLALLFPRSELAAGRAWESRIGVQDARLHLPKSSFTVSATIVKQQFNAAGPGWESSGHGSYSQLPQLRLPTLIAAGNQDLIVPARNATLLHGRIRNSKLVVYRGAGHAFLFQSPLTVAARVNRFLG